MNILLVSSFLPYPLLSGGQVRLYNLLKKLKEKHTVTLVCEIRSHQSHEDIQAISEICEKVLTVPRKKQWSISNVLKTGLSDEPFLLTGHKISEMKELIRQELAEKKYDLIHVETFYVMQNVPETDIPIVLVEHNIEYTIYEKYMNRAPVFTRPLLTIDIDKLRKKEELYWQKATVCVAVSEDDKNIIHKVNNSVAVVANGVDLSKFSVKSQKFRTNKDIKRILYIGDYTYIQNQDAALWIIKEVFPKIRSEMNDVTLWIVGRNMPQILKEQESEHISLEENSPLSTEEIFRQADILLAPIRIGGGTSYKILEAMACGTPVVTTSLGNEGIHAKDRESIIIADSAPEMVEAVKNLIEDEKFYTMIANNARTLVEENYGWDKITKDLENVYELVVR